MAIDAWLPIDFRLTNQSTTRSALFGAESWQIVELNDRKRALVAADEIVTRWIASALLEAGQLEELQFGGRRLWTVVSDNDQVLCPVVEGDSPRNVSEALSFAAALRISRLIEPEAGMQDAIYVEMLSRLLPTYTLSTPASDDAVLGFWLTGGANVSVRSFRRLSQSVNWIAPDSLKRIIQTAGLGPPEQELRGGDSSPGQAVRNVPTDDSPRYTANHEKVPFDIPGRPELAHFFNEHVVDIVQNSERYSALGIHFPSPVVLHGPPGCGKTFAVEKLVEYLDWPSFQIDASSVASPYIHETSRKVAQLFDKAKDHSPSVLIIDEMEAFLADRDMGEGHHRVEEVAEFLRRIPEAVSNNVLIIAMTNRIDMIDPAVLRRGRFDHVISVNYATGPEVLALIRKLLSALPTEGDLQLDVLVEELVGRPLSDVSFVVREAARLSARGGRTSVAQESLFSALRSAPAREREGSERRKIGFG